jgi:glutathione S-transferase
VVGPTPPEEGRPQRAEAPKIVLYGPAAAPFTEKVRRALLLKGLPFELREPSDASDYRRWNPETGLLPVVDIDGARVIDSTAILYRLEALFPEPPLLAREPRTAEQQRQLEDWADESFLWHFLKWQRMQQEEQAAQGSAPVDGSSRGVVKKLRSVGAWLRAGGTWERPHTALLRQIGDRLDDLLNFLGTRSFFYAEELSMADLAVYAMLFTLRRNSIPGTDRLLLERPALLDYMRRVEARTGG